MIPDRSGIRQRKDLSLCISWKGDATVFSSQKEEQSRVPRSTGRLGTTHVYKSTFLPTQNVFFLCFFFYL